MTDSNDLFDMVAETLGKQMVDAIDKKIMGELEKDTENAAEDEAKSNYDRAMRGVS